jgi:peroxiredoxin
VASLVGQRLPDVTLPCTSTNPVSFKHLTGTTVLFLYPWTGKPGHPNPENWDNIPDAHGSTPQCLAYSGRYQEFLSLGVNCYGVSQLDTAWQIDFAKRNDLQVPLLSDEVGDFAKALQLEFITTGGKAYLKRRTLICRETMIVFDRTAVTPPEEDATFVLDRLRSGEGILGQDLSRLGTPQGEAVSTFPLPPSKVTAL